MLNNLFSWKQFYNKAPQYGAIFLCAFLAYGSVLWNGAGFSHPDDVDAATLKCCDFRPILSETYLLNRHFGGWMLTNFGLHLLAGFGIWWLSGSIWAACLFVAHPMAADAVASVAGRSAILAALLVLLTLATWRKSWLPSIGLGIAAVDVLGALPSRIWSITGAPEHKQYVFDYLSALPSYIVPRLFIPLRLSADPEIHSSMVTTALGILLLSATAGAVIMSPPGYRLALALILMSLVPYMLVPLPDVFLEHRAYLALAGAALLIAQLPRRLLFVVLGAFIAMSHARAHVYGSPVRLWDDAAAKAPNKFRPHLNAGGVHYLYRQFPEAELELKKALAITPAEIAWRNLVKLYIEQNNLFGASQVMASYSKEGY